MPSGRTSISPQGNAKRVDLSFTPEALTDLDYLLQRGYASKSEAVRIALRMMVVKLKESDNYI